MSQLGERDDRGTGAAHPHMTPMLWAPAALRACRYWPTWVMGPAASANRRGRRQRSRVGPPSCSPLVLFFLSPVARAPRSSCGGLRCDATATGLLVSLSLLARVAWTRTRLDVGGPGAVRRKHRDAPRGARVSVTETRWTRGPARPGPGAGCVRAPEFCRARLRLAGGGGARLARTRAEQSRSRFSTRQPACGRRRLHRQRRRQRRVRLRPRR